MFLFRKKTPAIPSQHARRLPTAANHLAKRKEEALKQANWRRVPKTRYNQAAEVRMEQALFYLYRGIENQIKSATNINQVNNALNRLNKFHKNIIHIGRLEKRASKYTHSPNWDPWLTAHRLRVKSLNDTNEIRKLFNNYNKALVKQGIDPRNMFIRHSATPEERAARNTALRARNNGASRSKRNNGASPKRNNGSSPKRNNRA